MKDQLQQKVLETCDRSATRADSFPNKGPPERVEEVYLWKAYRRPCREARSSWRFLICVLIDTVSVWSKKPYYFFFCREYSPRIVQLTEEVYIEGIVKLG